MEIEIVTKQDLESFRMQLLQDLKAIISNTKHSDEPKYLRASQVRKLLSCSAGTLVNYRISGVLHPTKLGGTFYYDLKEIESLMGHK